MMKNKISTKLLFAVLCLATMNTLFAHQTYANPTTTSIKTYESIQSEISLRPWDTKGAG